MKNSKRFFSLALASVMIMSVMLLAPAPAQGTAADLSDASAWAHDYILSAIENGLVPEGLRGRYGENTTRAEFCALAVALYETVKGEITGRATFVDTHDINAEKAAYVGIVRGMGGNRFAPHDPLSRQQAATMLSRLAYAIGRPFPQHDPAFADNAQIAVWAFSEVGQVQAADIMRGMGGNRFVPEDPYTREQSIITILRLFDFVSQTPESEQEPVVYGPSASPDAIALENEMLDIINAERAVRGLPPLLPESALAYVARAHSADMARRGYLYHICADGLTLGDRIESAGILFRGAAQNIAALHKLPEEVVEAWMDSPGNRAAILGRNYTHLGIGLYIGGEHGYYWTAKFINMPVMPDIDAFEREVLDLVNIERANHGLQALLWDAQLAAVARAHSADMVHRDFLAHTCPYGLSPFDRMTNAGISYKTAGENIAAGPRTPAEVVDAWMNSPGHRAAILNADFTHLGTGLYLNSQFRYFWTQKFKG